MIFSTEKQLREFGDKLPSDKKSSIENALEKLKQAHKSQDVAEIDKAMAELNTIWQSSEEMYKTAQHRANNLTVRTRPGSEEISRQRRSN